MLAVCKRLEEIAATTASVIIEGETGTGKELASEAVHLHSPRADKAFVVVDCASIPPELIEGELFGHVRGAFTGAVEDRKGAFEEANGGTIFIDEIGELPLALQPKLLRVLERQEVKRVGATTSKTLDVRVIAATNRNLEREVAEGRFREDVFFRLKVASVRLPALRERKEEILYLAKRFLLETPGLNGEPLELRRDACDRLVAYDWPGNVRELKNVIDRGAAVSDRAFRVPDDLGQSLDLDGEDGAAPGSGVGLADEDERARDRGRDRRSSDSLKSPDASRDGSAHGSNGEVGQRTRSLWQGKTYKDARDAVMADFEQGYIHTLLSIHRGNVSKAARAAGIHRNILHRMMARYGIHRS